MTRRSVVQFYDFGHWDTWALPTPLSRDEARRLADRLNRETSHAIRQSVFSGRRFRVRQGRSAR